MSDITQRQAKIFAAIVKEYSQAPNPVGSEELVEKYNFGVSPATVRNEMKALEKAGYIAQPHTSAGRIPTDKGYRYFVNKLMKHLELTAAEQHRLQQELRQLQQQYIELGRSLTKLLAEKSGGAAFALLPESVTTSGLSNVIDDQVSPKEIREIARFIDELDDHRTSLFNAKLTEVETYIGEESPVPLAKDFSLVVARVDLPKGGKGVIGIVGPRRMKYARNISLLEYLKKLLGSGLSVYLIVNILQ